MSGRRSCGDTTDTLDGLYSQFTTRGDAIWGSYRCASHVPGRLSPDPASVAGLFNTAIDDVVGSCEALVRGLTGSREMMQSACSMQCAPAWCALRISETEAVRRSHSDSVIRGPLSCERRHHRRHRRRRQRRNTWNTESYATATSTGVGPSTRSASRGSISTRKPRAPPLM